VFGLRRAFSLAGAKTAVVSLWSVPGRAIALRKAQTDLKMATTAQLRQWKLGRDVLTELEETRDEKYKADDRPLSHPYYWGAWACQGDIGPFIEKRSR